MKIGTPKALLLLLPPFVLAGCDGTFSDIEESAFDIESVSASVISAPICTTVDFDGAAHGDAVLSLNVLGWDLFFTGVRYPGGEAVSPTAYDVELTGAALAALNATHDDTQAERNCTDCVGHGRVIMVPDEDFAVGGDNTEGGEIAITGFAADADGTWSIGSYDVVDGDVDQGFTRLYVDGTLTASSTRTGNATVETVNVPANTIATDLNFTIGELTESASGGVDNLQLCRSEPGAVGRMTGGGGQITVGDVRITRGFTIHCDITLSNNLEINWPDNKWHIDKPLTSALCLDNPEVSPEPPPAPFDTFIGEGVGRLNGVDGSIVRFTFVDSGEPGGKQDYTAIMIWAPGDDPDTDPPVLNVAGVLDHGNLQAHYDQPHGSNVNR